MCSTLATRPNVILRNMLRLTSPTGGMVQHGPINAAVHFSWNSGPTKPLRWEQSKAETCLGELGVCLNYIRWRASRIGLLTKSLSLVLQSYWLAHHGCDNTDYLINASNCAPSFQHRTQTVNPLLPFRNWQFQNQILKSLRGSLPELF